MTRTAHKYAWSLCAAVWSVLWVMYHLAGPLAEDYVLPSAPHVLHKPCQACGGVGVYYTGCDVRIGHECTRCNGTGVEP